MAFDCPALKPCGSYAAKRNTGQPCHESPILLCFIEATTLFKVSYKLAFSEMIGICLEKAPAIRSPIKNTPH